jgi:hypothetical protein
MLTKQELEQLDLLLMKVMVSQQCSKLSQFKTLEASKELIKEFIKAK